MSGIRDMPECFKQTMWHIRAQQSELETLRRQNHYLEEHCKRLTREIHRAVEALRGSHVMPLVQLARVRMARVDELEGNQ